MGSARFSRAHWQAGLQAIDWNGRFRRGVGKHEFRADLRVTSPVATVTSTVAFATDTTGPRLKRVSVSPLRFSVNEPADVTVVFDGTRTVTLRRLRPGRFTFPSGDPFTSFAAVARDFAGNEGGRSSTRSRDPVVVGALEPLEELDEELDPVELAPDLEQKRGGRRVDALRQVRRASR